MSGASPAPDPWDPLLRPTVVDESPLQRRPWRVQSAFFVGFFGGPFAALAVHLVNARRLRVADAVRRRVLLEGTAAAVALAVVAGVVVQAADLSSTRFPVLVSGVLVHLLLARRLRPRERNWQLRGVEPASMWLPGLGFVVVGLLVLAVPAALAEVGT